MIQGAFFAYIRRKGRCLMREFPVFCVSMILLFTALMVSSRTAIQMCSIDVNAQINAKEVPLAALTFDDGPDSEKTEALLDLLKEKGVKATFFVIGAQVEENADLIKRMNLEGHQIGIHTYTHVDLSCLDESEQREEIRKTEEVIEKIVDEHNLMLRPPFGQINTVLENWIDRPMILWSVDTEDWTDIASTDIIIQTVENVRDGDIILMHDISENGLEAASGIIDELHRMGYTFLTIEELFLCKEIELENGRTYRYAR